MSTEKIRQLNDQLRKYGTGGKILLTRGILALGEEAILHIMTLMQRYSDFSEDNDPYGEHDFGVICHEGKKCFWKIDYYDQQYSMHSPDVTNPEVTCRVLTLMLAEEY
jgi:hypothetical protein